SALVGLSGRVQESWTESQACRYTFGVANRVPHRLQLPFVLQIHFDIGEQCEIVARAQPVEVCFQIRSERWRVPCGRRQLSGVLWIREELYAARGKYRSLCGQGAGLFIRRRDALGDDLACLHVRLVERVDA